MKTLLLLSTLAVSLIGAPPSIAQTVNMGPTRPYDVQPSTKGGVSIVPYNIVEHAYINANKKEPRLFEKRYDARPLTKDGINIVPDKLKRPYINTAKRKQEFPDNPYVERLAPKATVSIVNNIRLTPTVIKATKQKRGLFDKESVTPFEVFHEPATLNAVLIPLPTPGITTDEVVNPPKVVSPISVTQGHGKQFLHTLTAPEAARKPAIFTDLWLVKGSELILVAGAIGVCILGTLYLIRRSQTKQSYYTFVNNIRDERNSEYYENGKDFEKQAPPQMGAKIAPLLDKDAIAERQETRWWGSENREKRTLIRTDYNRTSLLTDLLKVSTNARETAY